MSAKFGKLSEEERIEWAKNHEWEPRKRTKDNHLARAKPETAKKILERRAKDEAKYANPEVRAKKFGDDYNARIRYLYQHNEEFRELKKYRVALRDFRRRRDKYDAWTDRYYKEYKDKMLSKASIFKLEGTENYLYGFTLKDLETYSPVKSIILGRFIEDLIIPKPHYRGYKYKDHKALGTKVEEFYLVSEVEAYLNIFARYRKKFADVNREDQKKFLKKQFWKEMLEARKNFEDE